MFRFEKLSLSPWSNRNTLILSYSLNANFASLTEQTQATIYFLLYVIKLGLTSVICRVFYIFIPTLKEMFGLKILLIRFYKIILSCFIMLVCVFKVYNLYYFGIKHTLSVDVHPKPGPFTDSLKFCHWNLNSICARDKIKIALIEAYNSVFHYDLIALS